MTPLYPVIRIRFQRRLCFCHLFVILCLYTNWHWAMCMRHEKKPTSRPLQSTGGSSLLQSRDQLALCQHRCYHCIGRNPKLGIQLSSWCRGTKAIHGDQATLHADVFLPAQANACFDRHTHSDLCG